MVLCYISRLHFERVGIHFGKVSLWINVCTLALWAQDGCKQLRDPSNRFATPLCVCVCVCVSECVCECLFCVATKDSSDQPTASNKKIVFAS